MPEQYNEFINTYEEEHWKARSTLSKKRGHGLKPTHGLSASLILTNMRLENNHTDIIRDKREVIKNLASKILGEFFGPNGINEDQLSSLKVWAKLIGSLGKGTGKYALRKSRAAKEMQDIQEAIPCWVMPLYE